MTPRSALPCLAAICTLALGSTSCLAQARKGALPYPIVDTNQTLCFDNRRAIAPPKPGEPFFGQDGSYQGHAPSYRDNGDGTVSDLVTGLMWTSDPGQKVSFDVAQNAVGRCRVGGHSDWRLPTVKELYSLIDFTGTEPDPRPRDVRLFRPYINRNFFKFSYGNIGAGERLIDSHWLTSTLYTDKVLHGFEAVFGVNFADGRVKGYPLLDPYGGAKWFYSLYVRGNPAYGKNDFVDHGDGTVTDRATGLTWMQVDSGHLRAGDNADGKLNWEQALAWSEQLSYAGKDDWRLPSIKELHSIVDYTRSPATDNSPAIDPIFKTTKLTVEEGQEDYPYFWSGTSHPLADDASEACYIAFGRAFGYFTRRQDKGKVTEFLDVHGAGSQRADLKAGDLSKLPKGRGPQGDVTRIYNFVRCVRGGEAKVQP
jgi:hypothetical protein